MGNNGTIKPHIPQLGPSDPQTVVDGYGMQQKQHQATASGL